MDEQEKEKMREASKRLYAQLQDAEKKHQEEREKLLVSRFHFLAISSFISSKDPNVMDHKEHSKELLLDCLQRR